MSTEEIILGYWKSWQDHENWEETRSYMKDDFQFDAGLFKASSADELVAMMKMGNPWKDIVLLDKAISENKGALIYEGVDTVTNAKIRIAEVITVKDGKVASGIANITQLPTDE